MMTERQQGRYWSRETDATSDCWSSLTCCLMDYKGSTRILPWGVAVQWRMPKRPEKSASQSCRSTRKMERTISSILWRWLNMRHEAGKREALYDCLYL